MMKILFWVGSVLNLAYLCGIFFYWLLLTSIVHVVLVNKNSLDTFCFWYQEWLCILHVYFPRRFAPQEMMHQGGGFLLPDINVDCLCVRATWCFGTTYDRVSVEFSVPTRAVRSTLAHDWWELTCWNLCTENGCTIYPCKWSMRIDLWTWSCLLASLGSASSLHSLELWLQVASAVFDVFGETSLCFCQLGSAVIN